MLYAFLLILSGSVGQQSQSASDFGAPSVEQRSPSASPSSEGLSAADVGRSASDDSNSVNGQVPAGQAAGNSGYGDASGGWGDDTSDSAEVVESGIDEAGDTAQLSSALNFNQTEQKAANNEQQVQAAQQDTRVSWLSIMMYLGILAALVGGTAWLYRRV